MLLKMEEICQHDSVSNRLVKLQLKMARCTHCTIVIILQKIYIYICIYAQWIHYKKKSSYYG